MTLTAFGCLLLLGPASGFGGAALAARRGASPAAVGKARRSAPCMASPEYIFELDRAAQSIRFGCRQKSVTMVRPESGGSLHEFIGSSANTIVLSSWDPGQVALCEGTDNEYLIKVEEFDFVALRIEVELRARCTLDSRTQTAYLESLGFRLIGPGMERLADAIDVKVTGALTPSQPDARICALSGDVLFEASGKLPAVLRAAPEIALRAAARAMSQSLIVAASERFSQKVPQAYSEWARDR